jgi:hypothetical protein
MPSLLPRLLLAALGLSAAGLVVFTPSCRGRSRSMWRR